MNIDEVVGIYNQFAKIHNLFSVVKRNSIIEDGENNINPSEMQMLSMIYTNPDYSSTDIANELYITKSATSQLVKKLTSKGYILKIRDQNNERYVHLKLTDRGMKAVKEFLGNQSMVLKGLLQKFNSMTENEIDAIKSFLGELECMLSNKLS